MTSLTARPSLQREPESGNRVLREWFGNVSRVAALGRSLGGCRSLSKPIQALALDDERSQASDRLHLVFFALVPEDRFAGLDRLNVAVLPANFT